MAEKDIAAHVRNVDNNVLLGFLTDHKDLSAFMLQGEMQQASSDGSLNAVISSMKTSSRRPELYKDAHAESQGGAITAVEFTSINLDKVRCIASKNWQCDWSK